MEFVIKEEILNAVLQYLATKPYAEVVGLIQAIHEGAKPHGEITHEKKADGRDDQKGQES